MPLDKIEDTEEYAKTHESLILHIKIIQLDAL
jgi:hypothetical protein